MQYTLIKKIVKHAKITNIKFKSIKAALLLMIMYLGCTLATSGSDKLSYIDSADFLHVSISQALQWSVHTFG